MLCQAELQAHARFDGGGAYAILRLIGQRFQGLVCEHPIRGLAFGLRGLDFRRGE